MTPGPGVRADHSRAASADSATSAALKRGSMEKKPDARAALPRYVYPFRPREGLVTPTMSGYWLDAALIGLLVLLNAFFAGSEMALISLREGQLKQLERDGGQHAMRLVRLARDPNRFLATIQIGITLAGFLASATAAVSLAEPLIPRLGFLGSAAGPVAIAGVTLILTFFILILGELAPKRLAMQKALPWALRVAH